MATTKATELGQLGSKLTIHNENITLDGNVHGQYAGFDSDFTASSIGGLSNVDITTSAPSNNQSLIWDNANSKFVPGDSFSQSDFNTAFGNKSTSDLSEGTNEYHTTARARGSISATGSLSYNSTSGVMSFTQGDTDTISEGSSNLYYTDARADARVSLIVDAAPSTLNTLNELAAALGDDANFSTTVTNSIATKLPLAGGTMTGVLTISSGAPIIKLAETGVTNNPVWWHVADGGNYSIRLNNTGAYPLRIMTNSTNNTVDYIDMNYNTNFAAGIDVTGNITTTGTVDGVDIQTLNTTANAALPKAGGTMTGNIAHASDFAIDVAGDLDLSGANVVIKDSQGDKLFEGGDTGNTTIYNQGTAKVYVQSSGVSIAGDLIGVNLTATNNIIVTGRVDGRDVATDGTKLDGIESGATADQTAAQILTAVKTVDGSGSGLDADTVDGLHAASFLRSDVADNGYSFFTSANLNGTGDSGIGISNGSRLGFDQSGTRSWTVKASGGNLAFTSGDGNGNLTFMNNTLWHAGNDGSGSGLDADTVDGVQASSFLRNDAINTISNYTHRTTFFSNTNAGTTNSHQASLEVKSDGAGNDAFMEFHVGGDYATYFGLDGDTNDLFVGGWSKGSTRYKMWHQGNDGSGSGLDADTVDGIQGANLLRSDITTSIKIAQGTTAQRPTLSASDVGYMRYNTTDGQFEFWHGDSWVAKLKGGIDLEFLIVGGGGGGGGYDGGHHGASGGSGALISGGFAISGETINIYIGSGGGAGASQLTNGGSGSAGSSSYGPGGAGGRAGTSGTSGAGGGGGGATALTSTIDIAVAGGGGGGGGGNEGNQNEQSPGGGGVVTARGSQSGTTGGGGFNYSGDGGGGGAGGGGKTGGTGQAQGVAAGASGGTNYTSSEVTSVTAVNGPNGASNSTTRTGAASFGSSSNFSYGGGNGRGGQSQNSGGNGIAIIRYESLTALAVGGTVTTSGGYQIHTFTSNGTFVPS